MLFYFDAKLLIPQVISFIFLLEVPETEVGSEWVHNHVLEVWQVSVCLKAAHLTNQLGVVKYYKAIVPQYI